MLNFNLHKHYIVRILLIFLLSLSISGCHSNGSRKDKVEDNISTTETEETATPPVYKPDLVVSEFSTPNFIEDPKDFYIDLAVKNRGTEVISKPFTVALYLSLTAKMDQNSTFLLGHYNINKLAAGATRYIYDFTIKISPNIPVTSGATYYINVGVDSDENITESNESNNFSAIQRIKLEVPQVYLPNFADSYEEDDRLEDASILQPNIIQKHNFYDDITDWVKISMLADREYTIQTMNLGLLADTNLTLINEFLNLRLFDDNSGVDGNKSSKIVIRPQLNDDYYLLVSSSHGQGGVGNEYSIMVSDIIVGSEDNYEEDDTQTDAKEIYVDIEQKHNFYDDDSDWLYFEANKDGNYTIETQTLGANADTELILYDKDGTELMRDDNGSTHSAGGSLINWKAPKRGKYYIDIISADETIGDNRHYIVKLIEN